MAVLSTATSSGRQFYAGMLGTNNFTAYTAPANNSNVTSPSATAYIKEIIICNSTASSATVTIQVANQYIMASLPVNSYDTKVLSGLNIMIPAGGVINIFSGTASALTAYISGVEIQ